MDADQYLDYRWRALLAEGKDSSYISARIPLAGQQDYNTNWLDEDINPAPMKEHYLSYSGGDEKSAYNASLSYLDQDGIAGVITSYSIHYTKLYDSSLNDELIYNQ